MLMAFEKGDIQLIFGADGDMLDGDNFAALQAAGRFKTLISAPIASRALVMIVTLSLSLAIASLCVVSAGRWPDKLLRAGLFFLTAMPNYWVGLLLIWLLAVKWQWLPVGGIDAPGRLSCPR